MFQSWESLGEFVLKIDQSLDVVCIFMSYLIVIYEYFFMFEKSIKHSLKLLFESDASQPSVIGVESVLEKEKELESKIILSTFDHIITFDRLEIKELPNKKSKRKIKFDDVAGDDFSKRRSSRVIYLDAFCSNLILNYSKLKKEIRQTRSP